MGRHATDRGRPGQREIRRLLLPRRNRRGGGNDDDGSDHDQVFRVDVTRENAAEATISPGQSGYIGRRMLKQFYFFSPSEFLKKLFFSFFSHVHYFLKKGCVIIVSFRARARTRASASGLGTVLQHSQYYYGIHHLNSVKWNSCDSAHSLCVVNLAWILRLFAVFCTFCTQTLFARLHAFFALLQCNSTFFLLLLRCAHPVRLLPAAIYVRA